MLGTPTPEQQQQRIDDLTHTVNILGGKLAALTAYVLTVTPALDPAQQGIAQGVAQQLAPDSIDLMPKMPPKRVASEGVAELVSLAAQQPKL